MGLLLVLGGATLFISQTELKEANQRQAIGSTSGSFIISQREMFIFLMLFEKWSYGEVERRDVQIARASLSQRLSVITLNNKSIMDIAPINYLNILKELDLTLQSMAPGFLPIELQNSVRAKIDPLLDQIIFISRTFTDSFQKNQNLELKEKAAWNANVAWVILFFLFLLFIALGILVFWNTKTTASSFRRKQITIQSETENLNNLIEKLALSESTIVALKELSETKTSFVASVNHELRTPLTSIVAYLEIINDVTVDKPELGISKYLEVVDKNVNILLSLIEDILYAGQLDSNLSPLPDMSVDIGEVIDQAISVLEPLYKKSNIDINFSIDREVDCFVQGDVEQLNRVVINLLSNSIKFSKANSRIEIEVDRLNYGVNAGGARIVIRDYGIGIPDKEINKLFKRFVRADNAVRGQYPGTGLGLALVDQIVKFHGGSVQIESVEGEGTTIIVAFPTYLSATEKMVASRRYAVLSRAITAIEESSKYDLHFVTHTVGGAISLYTFKEESELVLDFSNWLNSGNLIDPIEVESRCQSILEILKSRLASLPQKDTNE